MENKLSPEQIKTMLIGLRIPQITDRWFLREPVLFMALLAHDIRPNPAIQTIRCGKGRIEYNPLYVSALSDAQFEEKLKAEVIRILLRHPYREPPNRNKGISYTASNITLNEYYQFTELPYKAREYWQDIAFFKQSFEFYYRALSEIPVQSGSAASEGLPGDNNNGNKENDARQSAPADSGDITQDNNENRNYETAAENAALWDIDEYINLQLDEIIERAQQRLSWGSLPGDLTDMIIATLKPVLDYRKILSSFRASVLSSNKALTRFRLNRRYGPLYMGKKLEFTTSLLIGVDVSGSISDEEINLFYSTINQFFKYGIQSLEVLQFDADIKGTPGMMKKACKSIQITGRGGTCFQPVIDYFSSQKKKYNGLIVFTDGFADIPELSPATIRKTLWVCSNKENYEQHWEWMSKRGRCCWVE
jgi:predicted metal-dependent peptidase